MATYFAGRKAVDQFAIDLDAGRAQLKCFIYEHWEDTDNTTTARCGDPGVIEVRKTVGITKRDEHALTSSIEGGIGAKGFFELKSKIEASIKKELSLHSEVSTSKTTTFSSPECGRKTMFVYQLIREYEFYYSRTKWGRTKTWERKIRERTNTHDFYPDTDEFDPLCKCSTLDGPEYDGMIVIDMGAVSIRAPYKKISTGIDVSIDDKLLSIANPEPGAALVRIPIDALPEMAVFLGDLKGETVNAELYEYLTPQPILAERAMLLADAGNELTR